HVHQKGHEHEHAHKHAMPAWGVKALAVGTVHGLAGSGAMVLMIMQKLPSMATGLLYIGVFGAGTIAGMLLISGLVSAPLRVAAGRYGRLHRRLCAAAGVGSVLFGAYYGYSLWFTA